VARTSLPKYNEQRGWVGGDTRTLYTFTGKVTGGVGVYPGGGPRGKVFSGGGWGPEATVRQATRAEAEEHWQKPLHVGWKVVEPSSHATKKKYSAATSDKVERTMHEFKRGTLRSGSGGKVKSRKQAIAIGLSQARRAGYKVPQRGHATMSLDARVRAYLSNMRPGNEIDARGMARALGGVDPLDADYALERAAKAGFAITSDGRWFGPTGVKSVGHARKKKSPAELERDIKLKELEHEREQLFRALGYAGNTPAQVARYHEILAENASKMKALK
jgi:hypothetical protein